ncbi:MAG TPA: TolC family outer membrane protein [Hyphomicrobiales bacterium]|nr:TolC family outer membrane protein [Hyphomicrobiales bacterium]
MRAVGGADRAGSAACTRTGLAAALVLALGVAGAHAQTLEQALSQTYGSSPTLNAQRAAVRATDENVPTARAGLMPKVFGQANVGREWANAKSPASFGGLVPGGRSNVDSYPRGYNFSIQQPLFDGFRTPNSIKQAEASILAARANLANTEETVLFDAVQAYMNVLRDLALWNLQKSNVNLLNETLRQTNERFKVGDVTRTDVAQAQASLAAARSAMIAAEGQLKLSRAVYQQVIGSPPGKLYPGRPADRLLPRGGQNAAVAFALRNHPAVLVALHTVDVDQYQVKIAEGALLPSVTVTGSAGQQWESSTQVKQINDASVVASLTVPIYQGGGEYAAVRKAKETLGEARIQADLTRDQVREGVVSAWASLESARAEISADQAAVDAAQIAANGVAEELKVGQRTTLDLLNAEQALLNAKVTLIGAQRDRVVASYAVLQAMGTLTAGNLGLQVARYDPTVHYRQVHDKWFGLRTPEGQ